MTFLPPGNELNGRELATLTWVVVGLGYVLSKPGTAKAIAQLVRAFSSRWIAGPLVGMVAWMAFAVWIGKRTDLWTTDLIKDSFEWFILSALLLYIHINRASEEPGYFRGALLDNVKLTAFFTFYVNVFVFSYPIELGLVLIATLLAGCSVVAEYRADARAVKRLCDGVLGATAIALLVFSTLQISNHWSTVDLVHQVRLLVLPIWLTGALLPYLYAWSLFSSYQMTLHRVRFFSPSRVLSRGTMFGMMLVLNFRTRAVAAIRTPWLERLASAPTFRDAAAVAREYLSKWKADGLTASDSGGKDGSYITPAIPIPGIREILDRERRGPNAESAPEEA